MLLARCSTSLRHRSRDRSLDGGSRRKSPSCRRAFDRSASEWRRPPLKLRERYYLGQRARLPIRKSTKPPANACGCEMIPIGTLNRSGDAVVPAKCLLPPFQTLSTAIAAATGEQLGGLRRPASRKEIGVIGAPYGVEKRVGALAFLSRAFSPLGLGETKIGTAGCGTAVPEFPYIHTCDSQPKWSPTGEAERLAGPRARPLEIPPVKR